MKRTRKFLVLICTIIFSSTLMTGCSNSVLSDAQQPKTPSPSTTPYNAESVDSILAYIESEGSRASELISAEAEKLADSLESSYNPTESSDFYDKCENIVISFRQNVKAAVIDYCKHVANSNDALENLNKCYNVWKNAGQTVYDASNSAYNDTSEALTKSLKKFGNKSDLEDEQTAFQNAISSMKGRFDEIRDDSSILSDVAKSINDGNSNFGDILEKYESQ